MWVIVNVNNHQIRSSILKGIVKKSRVHINVINVLFYSLLSHQFRQFISVWIFVHVAYLSVNVCVRICSVVMGHLPTTQFHGNRTPTSPRGHCLLLPPCGVWPTRHRVRWDTQHTPTHTSVHTIWCFRHNTHSYTVVLSLVIELPKTDPEPQVSLGTLCRSEMIG